MKLLLPCALLFVVCFGIGVAWRRSVPRHEFMFDLAGRLAASMPANGTDSQENLIHGPQHSAGSNHGSRGTYV
jgi:hypothetical protein